MHSELYPRESSCFWCDWTTAKTSHKSHWSVFSLQTSSIATSLAFYSTQTRYRYRYRPGTGHWRGDQARSRTVSVLAIKTDTVQVSVRTLIWASRSLGPGLGLKILGIGHIWLRKMRQVILFTYLIMLLYTASSSLEIVLTDREYEEGGDWFGRWNENRRRSVDNIGRGDWEARLFNIWRYY